MPTPLRRRLRLFRRYAITACALAVVAVALLVGAASQLLPLAEEHPQQIADWLSQRAGQQIAFDRLDTEWTRRGPLLRLDGLRIGPHGDVRVGQAEILLAMYAGLLPGHSLTEVRLRGLALTLQRSDDGVWSVQGLPSGKRSDPLDALRRLGEIQLAEARLKVSAPSIGLDTSLPRIDLRLRVSGSTVKVGSRSWIDLTRAPLTAVLDFNRDSGDGSAYLQSDPADLAAWASLLQLGGMRVDGGGGRLQAWAQLRARRITSVVVDADLTQIALSGAPLPDETARRALRWERLQARTRWRTIDGGWRLDAPVLRLGQAAALQRLDGLSIAGGRRYAVAAKQGDVSGLIAAAALSDQLSPALRRWLILSKPQLRVADLQIAGEQGGPVRAQGQIEELGFLPVGNSPGITGLRGRVDGDAQGGELETAPDATVRFDWPTGFGVVHEIQLAGKIVGWREGAGWQVATPALRVQAKDYGANVRGGLWFQNDGTRPRMQLAAQLDDVALPVARKFWIRSKMSKAAIDWLDMAVAGGVITGGTGLVSGDLDQWPFDNNDGRFEAFGQIRDGTIRFSPDWPAMQQVQADLRFIGNGFSLQGNGDLAGTPIAQLDAGIPSFKTSELYVRASTQADAAQLLGMLRKSPLEQRYGDTLRNLTVSGPATVNFDLLRPLRTKGVGGHLQGTVALQAAKLADARWNLAFDQVSGQAEYRDSGFAAEHLSVQHQGRTGELALRAGGFVQDPAQAFEARLNATLDAKELFDRAPQMEWLRPYVHGSAPWQVGVDVPLPTPSQPDAQALLTLRSELMGTTLDLPAPLDKAASQPLDTQVKVALPVGDGDIDVAFGKLVALKASSRGDQTGVRVVMGTDTVTERPPANGLVVTGRTASLDAIDWISLARGSSDSDADMPPLPGQPAPPKKDAVPLQQVDVQADKLLMIGGVFPQTRLRLRPTRDAVAVTLDGPSLAGQLTVPNADGGIVQGKLSTVRWQPVADAPEPAAPEPGDPLAGALPEPARRAVAEFDPVSIPPLALDIDDLRVGKMTLGAAILRSSRLTDGMQVDQLQLRSDDQSIGLTGAWRGKGDAASTRLSARVDSRNLGNLLQNLTLGGQLRGGEGQLELNAGWQGSPTGFALGSLDGNLKVDVRNGQLLEVDPGAGRVLGLLSVAQLPRRLMFDFRDFFSKGLAFNTLDGEVRFGDGFARTDAIRIAGPAAEIAIRGQTDLRAQTFDQTVDVNPKAGNLLTVVGAVAGGPVGAAVGAAANAVLGKPLGAIGAKTYHVTGPWKDPQVDVVEREARERAPSKPAPTGKPAASPR
ncbi:YhdP family protein [Xanthomonas vesicatoria]|uniref:YhdP family protein n=2 Tax=Xanthomonas vesicatoria TaxID=56460 RepID=UPI000F8CF25C|nr:YhdP family protein [Xanthomonas vesicatoria]MCC8556515.1 TIGR02099 family protein [Xanthomonas vesicatoria]MCC8601892.1 TIGR02099 family protein [Xanthomonas vesicatoria]MCC8609216.1 TIGR02099 family protein [Xanthomonas vesicatoria]MCC8672384.1 TIGR02099 family protein [Xanthomonas vesicatoria]MCC8676150.1 TIGR02099 family protein [Xanthomonas vesicatoria]